MYVDPVEYDWLYPGDIISGLELPELKTETYRLVSNEKDQNDRPISEYSVRPIMRRDFFVYLSHECDFNDGKIQFFVVTPMINIDMGLKRNTEQYEKLIRSNDVVSSPNYLNHFYFASHDATFPREMIVDFTRVVSVPVSLKAELLGKISDLILNFFSIFCYI